MIEIELNKLINNNLTPNEFCYLYSKYSNTIGDKDLISLFSIDLLKLEAGDWIKVTQEGVVIRAKFIDFVGKRQSTIDISSWIKEWVDLWPDVKGGSGKKVKGDIISITKKMGMFIKNYKDYTKEQIIEATKLYIEDRRRVNYQYIVMAHYFISKDGVSDLAAAIEGLKDRTEKYEFYKQV